MLVGALLYYMFTRQVFNFSYFERKFLNNLAMSLFSFYRSNLDSFDD